MSNKSDYQPFEMPESCIECPMLKILEPRIGEDARAEKLAKLLSHSCYGTQTEIVADEDERKVYKATLCSSAFAWTMQAKAEVGSPIELSEETAN